MKSGAELYEEFKGRVEELGVKSIGISMLTSAHHPDTTTAGVIRTLNNVLRLRKEGKFRPLRLDPNAG